MPLGNLAVIAGQAMLKLYDKYYGPTARQIKELRKDLLVAQKKIDSLRENNAAGRAELAKYHTMLQEQESAIKHWANKYHELVLLMEKHAMEPRPLDDNPYSEDGK